MAVERRERSLTTEVSAPPSVSLTIFCTLAVDAKVGATLLDGAPVEVEGERTLRGLELRARTTGGRHRLEISLGR